MLELTLTKNSLFFNILEAILDLVDVAHVTCSSTALKLHAVDSEHVLTINLVFHVEDFEQYHCDKDGSMCIAIYYIVNAVRCANQDDHITIKIGNENDMTLSFNSLGEITIDNLWHVDDPHFSYLQWSDSENYQASVRMSSVHFMHICKYLSITSDYGNISVTKDGAKFSAKGKIGHLNIKCMQPAWVEVLKPVTVTLNLKYMISIAKASTLFDEVKIALSEMNSVMVECKFREKGYIRYFLAPCGERRGHGRDQRA